MNVNQFVGLDSFGKLPDGSTISHNDKFGAVVDAIGMKALIAAMPVNKERMTEALAADPHLNSVPLNLWDQQVPFVRHLMAHAGITHTTLSDGVCTLKCAARRWVEGV